MKSKSKSIKGKIFGLNNSEDSMWYKFAPTSGSLKLIFHNFPELIFDVHDEDLVYSKFVNKERSLKFENGDLLLYLIASEKELHLILRKVKNWKKYDDIINKNFDFVKPKK